MRRRVVGPIRDVIGGDLPPPEWRSLVGDDVRSRAQAQRLPRRHQICVLAIEELEAVVAITPPTRELTVLRSFLRRRTEAVDVHGKGHACVPAQSALVLDHVSSEAMDE